MLCTDKDKKELFEFLNKRQAENTFFIGDIENFSLEEDFMDVWKFETDGEISTVLLRYYKFYLLSAENDKYLKEVAEIVNLDKNAFMLSGLEGLIDKMADLVEFKEIRRSFLANLSGDTFNELETDLVPISATVDDREALFDFQKSIEEFTVSEKIRESFGKELSTGTGRMYFIKEDGKIVSSATITAENTVNGMIIGVATDKAYRQKGYAKACVSTICKSMVDNGKSVVLFYDNPSAGKLYKSLGFVDVERWSMGMLG